MMETVNLDTAGFFADPLVAARTAQRPVGYVGLDIPEDILAAPPFHAAHLPWQRDRRTPWADRWLEDSFAGWARCIVEDWADGRYDFMESVVFTRGDDTSQRLYYYLAELQRQGRIGGPRPLIFDTARIRRPSSEKWTVAAVRRLASELGLDDEDLAAGIDAADRRRRILLSIDADRSFASPFYERVARASLFIPAESLPRRSALANPGSAGQVLLAGSSPPDDGLHLAVDAAGWSVAGEACDRNLLRLGSPLRAVSGDPAERIGRQCAANPVGPRSFHDRAADILASVEERGAGAVVFWLYEEDEAIAWDVAACRRALEARGIATLVLARRRWDLSDDPQDDIARFLGSLAA
ncbi:MAG: 2-hydroxyacyl-CoA dehydratase family protein [Gammaproteobacteria bacterium]|nr:2-hydroxyacyl-CoA dehydratase family protein [Gammaproteobacteria bacterium]MDH4253543.1 2-hydroxyacyl-CoA dehydratase family protein [Gammaproteobacteria bacterium]MDH5310117.1 2-hydroxyacyl-CoA dehydratase family protein [Gammaproteobacteria bacterium]